MGFLSDVKSKVTGAVKDTVSFADKATLGFFSAGLTDGTVMNDLLKKSGLLPGDVPNLGNAKSQAEAEELIKLAAIEKKKRDEAKFLTKEGQGMRRKVSVQFGNQSQTDASRGDKSSVRATGRFDENRLIL